jgi:hypothetical protein
VNWWRLTVPKAQRFRPLNPYHLLGVTITTLGVGIVGVSLWKSACFFRAEDINLALRWIYWTVTASVLVACAYSGVRLLPSSRFLEVSRPAGGGR